MRMQQFNYTTQPCRISFHFCQIKSFDCSTQNNKMEEKKKKIGHGFPIHQMANGILLNAARASHFLYLYPPTFIHICLTHVDSDHIKNKLKICWMNSNVIKINAHTHETYVRAVSVPAFTCMKRKDQMQKYHHRIISIQLRSLMMALR